MRALILGLAFAASALASAQQISMPVPGAVDAAGRKVLTFIAKDPPGQRCNGNLQVAAELANVYRVPIQLLPSSLAPRPARACGVLRESAHRGRRSRPQRCGELPDGG